MELIVVKENQTVRGVEMPQPLKNILNILLIFFLGLFLWNSAFGKTITMNVDGKEMITITVSEEETKEESETEEEPDCE